ncbi:MAG: BolA/IbaG family iron-sulfur metabolism protein [Rickettsiales bacterium]
MPLSETTLRECLQSAFPDAVIALHDMAGDSDHWEATVLSPSFAGMSRLNQHKAVYAALEGRVGGELHALKLSTGVPPKIE